MSRILAGVKMVPGHDDCTTVGLRNLLYYLGYAVPDVALASQWAFYYLMDAENTRFEISASEPDPFIGLRRHGLAVTAVTTDDPDAAWDEVKSLIDQGMPTHVAVDPYYLPYHRTPVHGYHGVLVYGYDNESAWVLDGWHSVTFMGPIPLEALRRARESRNPPETSFEFVAGTGLPIQNLYLSVRFSEEEVPPDDHLHAYMRELVHSQERSMCGDHYCGARGITRFAWDLVNVVKNNDDVRQVLRPLFMELAPVVTQRGLGRRLFSYAAGSLADERLQDLQSEASDLHRLWVIARNLFYKAARTEGRHLVDRIHHRLLHIAEAEILFSAHVSNYLRGLDGGQSPRS